MTVAMETVTKSIEAAVRPVDSENPNGEFVLILSKDNADRDDENLWAYEWMEPLPAKIHMDTDHAFAKGMSVPLTAGSGVPEISEDGDLLVKGGYAGTPHGQLTRQLVKEGHIWQASVSYQLRELADGRIVRELLNGTFTGVPCNPEAVVLSSKSNNTLEHATYQKTDAPLTPGTHHADPGYLDRNGDPAKGGNGVPRYQLDDASHVRNALARFSQHADGAKYTASQRSAVLGRIRSAARKFGIGVSDKGGEKALVVALCKAISLSKDHGPNTPAGTAFVDDVGAHSVYDPSDDEDHAEDDDDEKEELDVAQAIHDAATALGAACKHADHEHSALSSLEASLKSIVQPVIRGYNIVVAGPPGQEMFTLNKGDVVVGHGKLDDLTEAKTVDEIDEPVNKDVVDTSHADVNAATDGKTTDAEQAAARSGASPEEIEAAAEGEQQHKAVAVADPDTSEGKAESVVEASEEQSEEQPDVTVVDESVSSDSPPETLPQSADEKATAAADTKAAAAAVSPADLAARAKARLRNFQFNNDTTVIETETV